MTTDLRSGDRRWRETVIGGGRPAVGLVRLHLDPTSNATTSLVRFPPGWTRPITGHYPCAEELLVIDGELVVSGSTYREGDYGYLPPHDPRSGSSASGVLGALVLAWFSGPATWTPGTAREQVTHLGSHSLGPAAHRPTRDGVQGRADVVRRLAPRDAPGTVELVSLQSWEWTVVQGEEPFPDLPGPVFRRFWT